MSRKNADLRLTKPTNNIRGFRKPTTTPTPDEIFDVWLSVLTPSELRILLYIVRRTFGFGKDADAISLRQICEGIRTRAGRILDHGTGLSRRAAFQGVQSLEKRGLITVERQEADDRVNLINVYRLVFVGEEETEQSSDMEKEISQGVGTKDTYGRVKEYPGVGTKSDPTTNSIQQTDVVVINALKKFKVGEEKAEEIAAKYSPEHITEKIEFLEWKIETKARGRPIADPASWLIRAIEKDYKPPASFKPEAQREKEAEETALQEEERERAYQAQEEQREQERAQRLENLQRTYGTTPDDEKVWAQVLEEIQLATTKATYQTWFPQTTLLSLKDGQGIIGVPNQATREWLSGRLDTIVQRALEDVVGHPVKATFQVLEQPQNVLEH